MPYVLKELRPALDENPVKAAREPGDLTYVFARYFYRRWQKEPRWTTYHKLRKLLRDTSGDEEFFNLYNKLSFSPYFNKIDIVIAAELALNEFYRRVVSKYEDGKKAANGDVFKEEINVG